MAHSRERFMKKMILVFLLVLLASVSVAQENPDYAAIDAKFNAEMAKANPERRLDLVLTLLKKYPQIPNAERYLTTAVYLSADDPDKSAMAEKLVNDFLGHEGRSEAQKLAAKMSLIPLYSNTGKESELRSLIVELKDKKLNGYHFGQIVQASLDVGLYETALELSDKSLSESSLEKALESYGGREDFARMMYVRNRSADLTRKGAALTGLGKPEEALKLFDEAGKLDPVSMIGRSNSGYPYYKALAYKALGNLDKAEESLAPAAIFLHDKKSAKALKSVFLAKGNKEGNFEKYLVEKRAKIAPAAPDFTLNTFDGKPVSLSSFKGKVVFLNFWSYG